MALSNDLTEGSINKHLLAFAFPLIISNVMQALYNAVDMYFTGISAWLVIGDLF